MPLLFSPASYIIVPASPFSWNHNRKNSLNIFLPFHNSFFANRSRTGNQLHSAEFFHLYHSAPFRTRNWSAHRTCPDSRTCQWSGANQALPQSARSADCSLDILLWYLQPTDKSSQSLPQKTFCPFCGSSLRFQGQSDFREKTTGYQGKYAVILQ